MKEALKLALDWYDRGYEDREEFQAMIENLLAAPIQEPVAWLRCNTTCFLAVSPEEHMRTLNENDIPLYTAPSSQRKPLGVHEIVKILDRERMKWIKSPPTYEFDLAFVRAIEAAHGIKE